MSLIVGTSIALDNGSVIPAANPQYVIHGDTVYDRKSNLTWQRCSIGQQWSEGSGCVGNIKTMTFDDAQKQGDKTWRVPTEDELATLIDARRQANNQIPTIDVVAFPNMDTGKLWYWTSTPNTASLAWLVFFADGSVGGYGNRGSTNAVRLVRSGQ